MTAGGAATPGSPSAPPRGASLFVRGAHPYAPGPDGSRGPFDLRIVDGVIDAVGPRLEAGALPVLDARGLTGIPGVVDVHVHFRDPGLERKEGWERGSAGALFGGVTTVVEVQNNPPLSTSLEALRSRIEHVRARSRVDYGCLANLLPDSLPALDVLAPLTPAFKCFLGGSTGLGGQSDRATLRELFAGAARAGRMIVAHCQDEDLLRAGKARFPDATAAEHHLVRSTEAEVESIRTSIELVRETGAELHVFHVSTRGGADLLRAARAEGLPVSGSTAPHYLLLSCEDAPRLGNLLKVNPSIKTRDDSAGLLAALADGTIDAIGTDHAPHPLEEKTRVYAHSPSGMPSVDLLWPLTHELVRRGLLDADTALASVTSRAAESLHLPRKGRLAAGFDGDLALFDPGEARIVRGAELPSRSKWSAYEGWELAGFPRIVVRRGEIVFRDGACQGEAGGLPLDLEPPRPPLRPHPPQSER
jgi:dihydroorotase